MTTNWSQVRKTMRVSPVDQRLLELQERGIFHLVGQIDEDPAVFLSISIPAIIKEKGLEKIWVVINSTGGNVFDGGLIRDTINATINSGCQVNTLGTGLVASMAIDVLQAGSRRYSWPSTQFCIHQTSQMSTAGPKEVNKVIEDAEFLAKLNRIGLKVVAERIGMSIEELFQLSKKTDVWLSPEEALKFGKNGLIDEIITGFPD
jgi:ATP-dependent protease ClpP protease subunit